MKTNAILREIRRTRDQIARETDMDLGCLFDLAKGEEQAIRARGGIVIDEPKPQSVVREDEAPYPPKPGGKPRS